MDMHQRIKELERALEEERSYSKMLDINFDYELSKKVNEAEERGFQRGAQTTGDTAAIGVDFESHIQDYLNKKIPELMDKAIPDEYKKHPASNITPQVRVSRYHNMETFSDHVEVLVRIPETVTKFHATMLNY